MHQTLVRYSHRGNEIDFFNHQVTTSFLFFFLLTLFLLPKIVECKNSISPRGRIQLEIERFKIQCFLLSGSSASTTFGKNEEDGTSIVPPGLLRMIFSSKTGGLWEQLIYFSIYSSSGHFVFLLELSLLGFLNNLAIENIAGVKFVITSIMMLARKSVD
ncbi:uncharacterized protein LOC105180215 isoform X2 [Sesamum indicum]|uniref:Uncharacterized protein LOC105180215 isoform X2 n=1 Tax=Sesamum indicum TaxID=4182 RepID=A0A6I9UJP5_SESIN|nr:uncharacterized protein LOC105180215 isoform X2 [Sesamum indicum]XP_011102200.1 uncharacterized protein LOC105180215 isoform X2 [Sesamum indicum]